MAVLAIYFLCAQQLLLARGVALLRGAPSSSEPPLSLGESAPLTEKGYEAVAALEDDAEMSIFIRRTLASTARFVGDESGLSGFVPFHSGSITRQNLTKMLADLGDDETGWWVADGPGRLAPLSKEGFQQVSNLHDEVQMRALLRRMAQANGRKVTNPAAFNTLAHWLSCGNITGHYKEVSETLHMPELTAPCNTSAPDAALTDAGYVASDDQEMNTFVQKLLDAEGRAVGDHGGLSGFAPYFARTARDVKPAR